MADDKRTAPGASGGARRRRPAATIDLTATEVRAERPAADPQPAAQEPAFSSAPDAAPTAASRPTHPAWGLAAAGLVGGAAVALVFGIIWLANPAARQNASQNASQDGDLSGLRAQLAALQAQVRDAGQPKAAPPDKAPDAGSGERLAAIENAIKATGIALTALTKRSDDIAADVAAARGRAEATAKSLAEVRDAVRKAPAAVGREEIEAMLTRLAALESAAKATQEKVARSSDADAAARFALAALALRDAVGRGEPYAAEFAAAKALGADAKALAPLEPFASSGMPNDATLTRELTALLPAMLTAANADPAKSGGFIERLQANAGKLVRIRPVDAPAGDDPAVVLARIEVDTARNNVAGARAEIAKLPEKVRALAARWEGRVNARQAALSASRALAADAARALTAR